jgi:DsbC/DsbD-like thiol-disulfide interchange protein
MARRITLAAAILGLGLFAFAVRVEGQGNKSDSKVKITASASKPNAAGKQTVTVTLVHDKGWHTYANPVGNDDLASTKTVVTVSAKGKALAAKVDYPAGTLKKDKDVGDYKIYDDKTEIKAAVQRDPGDSSALEVNVTIFACDEKNCLPGATVKVTVP